MGDAVQLIDGTTAYEGEWRGGKGALVCYGGTVPVTTDLEMSPDNGTTWLKVYCDGSSSELVQFSMTGGVINFVLPRCYIRLSQTSGWTSGKAWAVGI